MPASRYCVRKDVLPSRAASKSFEASSMAAGGSSETEVGFVDDAAPVAVCIGSGGGLGTSRPILVGFWAVEGRMDVGEGVARKEIKDYILKMSVAMIYMSSR